MSLASSLSCGPLGGSLEWPLGLTGCLISCPPGIPRPGWGESQGPNRLKGPAGHQGLELDPRGRESLLGAWGPGSPA